MNVRAPGPTTALALHLNNEPWELYFDATVPPRERVLPLRLGDVSGISIMIRRHARRVAQQLTAWSPRVSLRRRLRGVSLKRCGDGCPLHPSTHVIIDRFCNII